MRIQQLYQDYQIMPSLQTHQYRVAGVAQMLCAHIHQPVDEDNIVAACLLHDMGNIIKFKLDLFPEFLEPEGFDYWNGVQQEYFKKYGNDEHVATQQIAKEILQSPSLASNLDAKRIHELIDAIGFTNAQENYESADFSRKIAAYSDMRVEPHGVVSLHARLEDGHKRFKIHKPGLNDDTFFYQMAEFLKKIETQMSSTMDIKPEDISEEKVHLFIPHLREFAF